MTYVKQNLITAKVPSLFLDISFVQIRQAHILFYHTCFITPLLIDVETQYATQTDANCLTASAGTVALKIVLASLSKKYLPSRI